jgi:preprotein translocase SecE subunit
MAASDTPTVRPTAEPPSAAGVVQYLREVRAELKPPKTEWPSRAELIRLTQIVLILIVIVATYCGGLDGALSYLVNRLHLFNR